MVKIKAKLLFEGEKALKLDCEGDIIWVPLSSVKYNPKEEELELPEWLYKQKFPNEPI